MRQITSLVKLTALIGVIIFSFSATPANAAENTPPVLHPIGNQQGNEGEWFVIRYITATDMDNDTLTITADNLPAGVRYFQLTSEPGLVKYKLRWPDTQVRQGTYNVTFTASDGNGGTASETITITIADTGNKNPTLYPTGDRQGTEGEWFVIRSIVARDLDNDTLTITADNLPAGVRYFQVSSQPGYVDYRLRWPDRFVLPGDHVITFTASDGNGGMDSETITISIAGTTPTVVRVTDGPSNEKNPDLVMSGTTVYAVWTDEDVQSIYFAKSPDGGLSWEGRKTIGSGSFARICIDEYDNLYVAIEKRYHRYKHDIYFVKSVDGGSTFTVPLQLYSGDSSNNHGPDITVSQYGEAIYLVWDTFVGGKYITYLSKSTDGGQGFSVPKIVSGPAAAHTVYPRVLTKDDGDYVWVTYLRKFTPEEGGWADKTMLTNSDDYGETFDTARPIASERHNSLYPNMMYLPDGTFNIIWQHDRYRNNHIYIRRSYDMGQTFDPPVLNENNFDSVKIDDGDFYATDYAWPSAAVDGFGNIYVAFADATEYVNGFADVYFNKLNSEQPNFGEDMRLDDSAAPSLQQMPSVGVDVDGSNICVMWQDGRSGNFDIYCVIIRQ